MKLSGKRLLGSESVNRFLCVRHYYVRKRTPHSCRISPMYSMTVSFQSPLTMIPYAMHQLTQCTTNFTFDSSLTLAMANECLCLCGFSNLHTKFSIRLVARVLLLNQLLLPSAHLTIVSFVQSIFSFASHLYGLS